MGTIVYGTLVGVGWRIKLQNLLPLLAGALVLVVGTWSIGSSVVAGWTLGHATILVAPLMTARELALPSKRAQLAQLRIGSSVCLVSLLVYVVLVQI